jgi:hypothetical protein
MKFSVPIPGGVQRRLLIMLFFFSVLTSHSQTNISGVVNTYRSVVEIIPAKACIRVNNISGINVNTRIMVVQMKGATISTANNVTFGDTTTTNEAGMYDVGTICYIRDDSVFLFHNLVNSYNTTTGKVQLVVFAEYFSANVVDTVKAAPWNNTTGTGGVIALYADQDITLNAPVYADSAGYRGGLSFNQSGTCNFAQPAGTGYAYDATSTSNLNGAYKGEGIADVPASLDGGKGAPANGGGGGNNHNNSGGGGANLASGGNGGGNSSSGPVGCNIANNWGRGGKALKSWSGAKIYMGGGGGAGHANNGSALFNYGGNGGGIIFIWAAQLNGNNQIISAGGGTGGASQSDGAGGGGAGGTIIMHVANYTGNVTIQANGGNGGLSDDGTVGGRCFGGGGGGSGGTIYFTGAVPAVAVTAVSSGAAGAEISRDIGCNAAVPAAAGNSGTVISAYTFTRSTSTAGYCSLLLPSKLVFFTANELDKIVKLSWRVLNPELADHFTVEKKDNNGNWMEILTIPGNNNTEEYASIDNTVRPGDNYYRLRVTEKSNAVYYSAIRYVVLSVSAKEFYFYPNPATHSFIVYRNNGGPADLRLTDMTGKLVLQKRIWNRQEVISVPGLPAGIYLLQVNQSVRKLVVH